MRTTNKSSAARRCSWLRRPRFRRCRALSEEAIAIAKASNPSILAARAREAQGDKGVDAARGRLAPQFDLVGNAGFVSTQQDGQFDNSNVGLSAEFRFPLFDSGLLSSRTAARSLMPTGAKLERMAVERQVTAQVSTAWHRVWCRPRRNRRLDQPRVGRPGGAGRRQAGAGRWRAHHTGRAGPGASASGGPARARWTPNAPPTWPPATCWRRWASCVRR